MMSVKKNLTLGAPPRARRASSARSTRCSLVPDPEVSCRTIRLARCRAGSSRWLPSAGHAQAQAAAARRASLARAPIVKVFEVISHQPVGTTVLLAEQNAYSALAIAHRAYVIERGHYHAGGHAFAAPQRSQAHAAYIGARS
jgi:branched-chain amino acid transport system ATP-binding protein